MPFLLRLAGRTLASFETAEEALARARDMIRENADQQPEVVDSDTGKPVAPGATEGSRERLARKVGF